MGSKTHSTEPCFNAVKEKCNIFLKEKCNLVIVPCMIVCLTWETLCLEAGEVWVYSHKDYKKKSITICEHHKLINHGVVALHFKPAAIYIRKC